MRSVGSDRWSGGGSAVALGIGQGDLPARTLLRETAWTFPRPAVCLPQNALTVVPSDRFRELMGRPDPKWVARRALARWNVRTAERVVVLSHAMHDLCRPLRRHSIDVVPVTVPVDAIEASVSCRWTGDADGDIVVLGTIAPYKRIETVVDALATAKKARTLRLIGDANSPYGDSILARAAEKGVKIRCGSASRAEVFEALRSAYCVVLPSAIESLAFPVGEALAFGAPLLASDIPAHREVLDRSGLDLPLFVPGDSSRLAALLNEGPEKYRLREGVRERWLDEWVDLRSVLRTPR